MTIKYDDVLISFNMWLEKMTLFIDFDTVELGDVHVTSDLEMNLEKNKANQHVLDYFQYAFAVIIPWVNAYHPVGVS